MTDSVYLDEAGCWQVSGLRDAAAFFRAVPRLLPEATRMLLEGSPDPDVVALLAEHVDQAEYGAPVGTLWSWPQRERRFTLRASPALFAQLSEAASRHAEPEICSHLHFYRDAEPLAQWFDAFDDPFLISKAIPHDRLARFAQDAGGTVAESVSDMPHATTGESLDYATLSLAEVSRGLDGLARDAQESFGGLDARQLNWRPDATRWSVAQCFDHLLTANRLMFQAAEDALDASAPRSVWQRLPVLPGLFGRMMVRSQAPGAARKFTAPAKARPHASDIPADVIERFIEQHRRAAARAQSLDERDAARAIMTSPFARVVTYSVLDGWRLVFAHDCRHVEQARGVMQLAGFPRA